MQPRAYIIHNADILRSLIAFLSANHEALAEQGKPLEVVVSLHKTKRHNQQNRLYWSLLRQIAEQAMVGGKQYSDQGWHFIFAGSFIGWVDMPGGNKMPISTTTLSVGEFADYVNKVQAHAISELGVIFEV